MDRWAGCLLTVQALMLFLVGSLDSPPVPSPLLKAPRLPFEAILTGAGLMTGTKSARVLLACPLHLAWS